ncbi:MAG: histone deacetylase [Thermosynechococcaceae cyanobacterium MS004]|nr:histone deacetylase [Thermosynechococcaceae cyanobacterium MS004]
MISDPEHGGGMTSIIYSDVFLQHDTGLGHPECADRLRAVVQQLQTERWVGRLRWQSPTALEQRDPSPWILMAHDAAYLEKVGAIAGQGGGFLDPDTPLSRASHEVARLAVNAWLDGVDAVLGKHQPAFVLARPPGHHALPHQGMGFCVFANAAIAALYALTQPGIKRVAILDWDVHHGNGTQAIVQDSPQICYCSLHQSPAYPGTGAAAETGRYNNVLNIPMRPGSTIAEYAPQFEQKVVPFLQAFRPDLLIVSAGYDANQRDPLANMRLQPSDYGRFMAHCLEVTPKVLLGLEGGYDFDSLAESVEATLLACPAT